MNDDPTDNVVSLRPRNIPAPVAIESPDYTRVETIITCRELGDIQLSQERDGWRVDSIDYWGDSACNVDHSLPTRQDAIRSALAYALGMLGPTRRPAA